MYFLEWSKRNSTLTVTYIIALQFAMLLDNYGRRFLAHALDDSICDTQSYPYYMNPLEEVYLNATTYRASQDFGLMLGLSIFLTITTIAIFIGTMAVCVCIKHKNRVEAINAAIKVKENRYGIFWSVLKECEHLFFNCFIKCMSLANGWFVSQVVVGFLAKTVFYNREKQTRQWQCNKSVDAPTQQLLSMIIINVIAFNILMLMYMARCVIKRVSNPVPYLTYWLHHYGLEILRTIVYVVVARWFAFAFVPLMADVMFADKNIYLSMGGYSRDRFHLQVAYELFASFAVAVAVLGLYNISVGPRGSVDMQEILQEGITFVIALLWGAAIGLSLVLAGAGSSQSMFYPTFYPGELIAATIVVTAFLLLVEAFFFSRKIRVYLESDMYQSTIFPLIIATAYPIAYVLSNDLLVFTGRTFNTLQNYPDMPNFAIVVWAEQGILVANTVIMSMMFGLVIKVKYDENFLNDILLRTRKEKAMSDFYKLRTTIQEELPDKVRLEFHIQMVQENPAQRSVFRVTDLCNWFPTPDPLRDFHRFVSEHLYNREGDPVYETMLLANGDQITVYLKKENSIRLIMPLDDSTELATLCDSITSPASSNHDAGTAFTQHNNVCVFPCLVIDGTLYKGLCMTVPRHLNCWSFFQLNSLLLTGEWFATAKIEAFFTNEQPWIRRANRNVLYPEPAFGGIGADQRAEEEQAIRESHYTVRHYKPGVRVVLENANNEGVFVNQLTGFRFCLCNAFCTANRQDSHIDEHFFLLHYNSNRGLRDSDPRHFLPIEYFVIGSRRARACYLFTSLQNLHRDDPRMVKEYETIRKVFTQVAVLRGFFNSAQ